MNDRKIPQRVLIMAGGTGGHVFPGLALARYLSDHDIQAHWLGTSQGLEARVVPEAGFPLHMITINGLRGKGIKPLITAPFKILKAIMQAKYVMKVIRPDVVIGMGGFVSGPGGIASWLLGFPLVIHEQNAKAGFTNKVLARFARRVLEGFPGAFPAEPKVVTVGNPVRAEIEDLPPPIERFQEAHKPFRLLVVGGSLGAQALNEKVPAALSQLPPEERPEIWHQTGERQVAITRKIYEDREIKAKVVPFIEDMAEAYRWADMVLCRAGALTISELCAVGLGAILVPYPHAVDDHQTANAEFMVKNNAALCIQQADLTDADLAAKIKEFGSSPDKRLDMSRAAYHLRKDDVVKKIFDILSEVIN